MRCVSYTRTTSCGRSDDVPQFSIAEQNEHIREYVKAHRYRLQKKYSDRKADPDEISEFERMRIDGLNRSFDLLVFDSLWQCGRDVFTIVRVLKDSFYPAGIQFAVVQDDFCSVSREYDEVINYLENAWSRFRGHLAEDRERKKPVAPFLETYGYRLNRETDTLEIDKETAAVVREIFEKILKGENYSEICKELNRRGVETPGEYLCRVRGWDQRWDGSGWNQGILYSLAKNPKFTGRWKRIENGKNYADDCEPIIEPEIFDEVQRLLDQRRHHYQKGKKKNNPFLKMMTDEETGAKVIMKRNLNTGIWDFHFQPRKPEGVRYERTCMDYDEAIRQIREVLKREYDKALTAAGYVDSDQARSLKNMLIEEKRKPVPRLLQKLFDAGQEKMKQYMGLMEGEISETEYVKRTKDSEKLFVQVADNLDDIYREIADIKMRYSKDNPWIKLFITYDEEHELTRSYLKRFCEHVHIWRFEEIRPVFRETIWRDGLFPEEGRM